MVRKNITTRKSTGDPKRLNFVGVTVYETVEAALIVSYAVPNVLLADLCTQPNLHPSPANRRMKMFDSTEAGVVGAVARVPVTAGDLMCQSSILAANRVAFSLIIGRPATRAMKDLLDFYRDIAILRGDERTVTLLIWTDG